MISDKVLLKDHFKENKKVSKTVIISYFYIIIVVIFYNIYTHFVRKINIGNIKDKGDLE